MRSFVPTQPIGLAQPGSTVAPRRLGRFILLWLALYCLPPLLLWLRVIAFDWRFRVLLVMTLVMLCYDCWRGMGPRELGFRRDTLRGSLLHNLAVSLLLVGLMLWGFKAGVIRAPGNPGWRLFCVHDLLVSSPSQEFLFRSNLFALMNRSNIRGPFAQVTLSAVTYSFLHIFYNDPLTLAVTLFAGLLWGWIYYKYPNFWGVALSHAALGATAILVGLI